MLKRLGVLAFSFVVVAWLLSALSVGQVPSATDTPDVPRKQAKQKKASSPPARSKKSTSKGKQAGKNSAPQPGAEIPTSDFIEQRSAEGPLAVYSCVMDDNARLTVEIMGARALNYGPINSSPVLVIRAVGTSDTPVEAWEISCEVTDAFGAPIKTTDGSPLFIERMTASSSDRHVTKGEETEAKVGFPRKPQSDAYQATVWVSKVRLTDGTVWQQSKEEAAAKAHGLVKSTPYKED